MKRNGFIKKMFDQINVKKVINEYENLPYPGLNREYRVTTFLEAFIVSIWYRANRFV